MSAVFQQKMIQLRAGRIRKGETPGEKPRTGAPYGEFAGVASMIQGARGGFEDGEVDLGARYLGIRQDFSPRRPVIKADHEQYVSAATAMDGPVARERLAKADATGFPADRTELDDPNKPAPKPPQSEATDFTSLMAKINAAIAASVKEVLANAPASLLATTAATLQKSEQRRQPTEAEVQKAIAENIAFLKRTEREPRQRVTVIKSEDGREVPFILRPHRAA